MSKGRTAAVLAMALGLSGVAAGCAGSPAVTAGPGRPSAAVPSGTVAAAPATVPAAIGTPTAGPGAGGAGPTVVPDGRRAGGTGSGGPPAAAPAASGRPTRLADLPPAVAATADCAAPVLTRAASTVLDRPASGPALARVSVFACRNGFARVLAVAEGSTADVSGMQLFLRFEGGTWRLAGQTGPAGECGDPNLPSAVVAVCAGLS
ncbi:hypothetical protein [Micromonospora auratinigra]|uniref:Uncharacterized protein n=1 Tax=Micromonospora auratinigra TaxID=261654 RepID=A0A1A8ZPM0_9ACTN|nr:hypothetical protein [Micromonospora auratinigra]SBT45829.1 hypothetical protein GA0070611_3161 [Micromonospora auratinigra]